jgi:hypothetical protein
MSDDVARTSISFFVVAALLTLFAAYSYFSPLALQTQTPWAEAASRALAHFGPVLPALIVGIALRHAQVWAWYVGVLYMAFMFSLGVYLSIEHFVFLLHGFLVLPVFLLLSVVALPSLILLLKGKMRVLHQLLSVTHV